MSNRKTIVLVLRSGGDFTYNDVELALDHINGEWKSEIRPQIICLWDRAKEDYDLGNVKLIPITNQYPGTWSRIQLYSPEMEKYRPFLYVDLDTAIIQSLENIFDLVENESKFITLEDFWQKGKLATGLVWFPAKSEKIKAVWNAFWKLNKNNLGFRMDAFLWKVTQADIFWQGLTNTIKDFKERKNILLTELPKDSNLVCFHGKPRIFDAQDIKWVKDYVSKSFPKRLQPLKKVTVIIPYNKDRGFLKEAIASVPKGVQLLISKGDGTWTVNFNKVLNQATGDYIKYLHEDDILTPNCIEDSIMAMENQNADFIHGNALEFWTYKPTTRLKKPRMPYPTLEDMLKKNVMHSATLMYKREVFEKLGGFDEKLGAKGGSEEYEFNLRCLKAGMKIGYCDATLAHYRRHPQQKIRTTKREDQREEREMVKEMYR